MCSALLESLKYAGFLLTWELERSGKNQAISLEVKENIGHLIICIKSKDITVLLLYSDIVTNEDITSKILCYVVMDRSS